MYFCKECLRPFVRYGADDRKRVRQAVGEAIKNGLVTKAQLLDQADRRRGRVKMIIQEILEEVSQ
jgi:hypothetical protein